MIDVRNIFKSFGTTEVLRGVTLSVPEGKVFVLLGGSGSGKTVLMKHLEGLLKPDSGSIYIDGVDLCQCSDDELQAIRRELGIQFQAGALFDSMSVWDNVAFPLREVEHLSRSEVTSRVDETLAILGLVEASQKLPGDLSGGMKKRVAFARAMVMRPKILLADEPTAGLDPLTTDFVDDAIITAQKTLGATAFLITHDLPTAFRVADLVGLLYEGQVIEVGTPDAFRASTHPAVKAFLHDWIDREAAARLT